jgi:TolB-like protein/class 3 adenylate cyclase/Tfp pilus assembly protein PilF
VNQKYQHTKKTHKHASSVRRLAAIMFSDIVGYTSLMGKDEARAFKVLRKNREIQRSLIEKYQGEWLKEMGDGILSSFYSATDAIQCAQEIQKQAKVEEIILRIGIHQGEVVFEDNDVFGDGVNVASRLQELADPYTIYISGTVQKEIKNKTHIKTEFVAERSLKNVDEPIKIFNVISEKPDTDSNELTKKLSAMTDKKSIIVLPFENMSPDPDQDYFSDGLTEEIITDLSYIEDLLVISRSSAMTYKGTKKKVKEIAKEVDVQYVLEGSVRKAGNHLRIIAQLIDGIHDAHIWAEKYTGMLDNVFEIQESVSRSIADSLKLKLTDQENEKISQKQISDIQAYEYYLKAKNEIYTWTEPAMERALDFLQKGLEIAGDNILLYYGIGMVHWVYINIGFKDKEECIEEADKYVKKIFELDADSVYGHRLLGIINLRRSNLQEGVNHLKKTLAQDPNDPDSLLWLTVTYCNVGRPIEAMPWIERAMKIDPFNPWHPFMYAWAYLVNGQFNKALEISNQTYKMAENHPTLPVIHAVFLSYKGLYDESYAILDHLYEQDPLGLWPRMGQCLKYALKGDKENTIKAMSDGVKDKARCDLYDALLMAECDALIGEKEEAITSLEYAVNLGAINYPFYAEIDPFLENIREEPQFKKLMERVKYEWENFEV